MALYSVTDTTTHFSRGDEQFDVVDGLVEIPSAIAADYVQAGILILATEEAPAEKPVGKKKSKTAAADKEASA